MAFPLFPAIGATLGAGQLGLAYNASRQEYRPSRLDVAQATSAGAVASHVKRQRRAERSAEQTRRIGNLILVATLGAVALLILASQRSSRS